MTFCLAAALPPASAGTYLWYLSPENAEVQRTAEIRRLRQLGFDGEMLERSAAEQARLFTRTAAEAEVCDRLLRTPG